MQVLEHAERGERIGRVASLSSSVDVLTGAQRISNVKPKLTKNATVIAEQVCNLARSGFIQRQMLKGGSTIL